MEYSVAYQTTSFVKASITDVVKTPLEAIRPVFLVMYLFLQNFRATLIPTIAVPVVLMGTFAKQYARGYSDQTQSPTMFRDAVEDRPAVASRHRGGGRTLERISERGGPDAMRGDPRNSMGQIQGALV
ncbi:efflux RND transporter permease subunit [Klebsiella pneumoniae]|nr:efflux RND transporter permease subunit [Klebsiella pneumoniae]